MTETYKRVILQLLAIIQKSTLSVQGEALVQLTQLLQYARTLATEVQDEPETDGVDEGVPSGDRESD